MTFPSPLERLAGPGNVLAKESAAAKESVELGQSGLARLKDAENDMVVEGANDTRLAIECDGDEYHGPDRWQDDTKRQRVLERAGWTFWRCFVSTWSLHREDVLAELLERLGAMGIEPIGATDHVSEPC